MKIEEIPLGCKVILKFMIDGEYVSHKLGTFTMLSRNYITFVEYEVEYESDNTYFFNDSHLEECRIIKLTHN